MREGGARRARERRAEVGEVGQGEIAGTPGVLRLFPDQSALGNSLWRPGKALFASPTRLQPPPGLPPPSRGQPFQRAVSPLPPRRGPSVLPCPPRSPSAADSRPTNCPRGPSGPSGLTFLVALGLGHLAAASWAEDAAAGQDLGARGPLGRPSVGALARA